MNRIFLENIFEWVGKLKQLLPGYVQLRLRDLLEWNLKKEIKWDLLEWTQLIFVKLHAV